MRENLISLSNNNITTVEYHQNLRIPAVFIWGCRGGEGRVLFVCLCKDFTLSGFYLISTLHRWQVYLSYDNAVIQWITSCH